MLNSEIYTYIDHTLLKAFATWEDIEKICEEAIKFDTASVCIPQNYVRRVFEKYGTKLNICTVVGFPLGYNLCEAKVLETKLAIENGANEIDMVINITDVKNGDFNAAFNEIVAIKKVCGEKILKVIIETCYLTKKEKIQLCQIVTEAKADFIKTSTGFGTAGATLDDVLLFKENVGDNVKIKAAGGVKTKSDLEEFIKAGCTRIGTSSAISILAGEEGKDY